MPCECKIQTSAEDVQKVMKAGGVTAVSNSVSADSPDFPSVVGLSQVAGGASHSDELATPRSSAPGWPAELDGSRLHCPDLAPDFLNFNDRSSTFISDTTLLCHTLWADGSVPLCDAAEFERRTRCGDRRQEMYGELQTSAVSKQHWFSMHRASATEQIASERSRRYTTRF